MDRQRLNRMAILRVLRERGGTMSTAQISGQLLAGERDMSERTVRLYLQKMEGEGLIRHHGKRGSEITPAGIAELDAALVMQRIGSLSARIDRMTYLMDFDLASCAGTVVVNVALIEPAILHTCCDEICQVFARGYAMGNRVCLLAPGERLGDQVVPEGLVGLCTVCSISVNGVLLKHGVPIHSRFGGLLELCAGSPLRFCEFINYDGTSLDPLEIFILSRMTSYRRAIVDGNGRIGASFREIPPESRDTVALLARRLEDVGMGGFMAIGHNAEPLLGVPVLEGRAGAVVVGGLNPVAVVLERGLNCQLNAMSGYMPYHRLHHYEELPRQVAAL